MKRVCVIGDISVDFYEGTESVTYVGGNAVNVSMSLLRNGCSPSLVGVVGNDAEGGLVRRTLSGYGLDISHLRTESGSTGWTKVLIKDKERNFVAEDIGVQELFPLRKEDLDFIFAGEFSAIHITGFTNWPTVFRNPGYRDYISSLLSSLRGAGCMIAMDFSDNMSPELLASVCGLVDMAFFSCPRLTVEESIGIAHDLAPYSFGTIILTMGKAGAYVFSGGERFFQPIVPIEVVDTLGAGDSFIGAFIASTVKGNAMKDVLYDATAYAAKVCATAGPF